MAKRYTATEKAALVARYEAGETIAEIAASLGRNYATINENLKNWGATFRRSGPPRTHALNERFFQTVDTEAKAYWLGFLYADGNVHRSKHTRRVQIGLQRRDRGHLHEFAAAIGFSGPVFDYVGKTPAGRTIPMAGIHVCSAAMCRDLIATGCVERKTDVATLLPPTILPELLRHFYRGYFDGDGCLSTTARSPVFSMVGHPTFIVASQDWLVANCELNEVALITPRICKKVRVVQYSGRHQVRRIMDTLYADATMALARKAAQYRKLIAS